MEFLWTEIVLRYWPIALGAAAGFAYYKFIGCRSGVCPITNNPWVSSIYGALMGAFFSGAL